MHEKTKESFLNVDQNWLLHSLQYCKLYWFNYMLLYFWRFIKLNYKAKKLIYLQLSRHKDTHHSERISFGMFTFRINAIDWNINIDDKTVFFCFRLITGNVIFLIHFPIITYIRKCNKGNRQTELSTN